MTTAVREAEKIVKQREREARRQAVAAEAARIDQEERRRAARDAHTTQVAAMREAEARLRAHEGATTVVVTFFDLRVTAHLERSSENLLRQQAMHALTEAVYLMQSAFEERVGLARVAATGRPEEAGTWTADYVERRVRDACRHGVASGLVTVERI